MKRITRIAVFGLGTMGHGIVQTFALAGCAVRGYDDAPAAANSCRERIRRNLDQMADAGIVKRSAIAPALRRITLCTSERDTVRNAEFVTEAVREELEPKRALFERLEALVSPRTILASNSSTFTATQIAARLRNPGRCVNTHWFNPPHIVPVVEVIAGKRTAESTTRAALALLEQAGKVAVRIDKELPGFVVNRVQAAMIREVWDLWSRGVASAEDIDKAIRGTLGFRLAAVGPLQVCDFGGLDIWRKVFENLAPDIRSDTKLPARIRERVESGQLGIKTGKGIFDYTPKSAKAAVRERDHRFLALAKLFYATSSPAR